MSENIRMQAYNACNEIIEKANLKSGQILVIGCSTSEVGGGVIGHNSNIDLAKEIWDGVNDAVGDKGIFIAAQCCEHLNRAIVVEREVLEKYNLEEVCVVPKTKAGGSWATTCYERFKDPVVVESIKAHAGLDIGLTLIGMHLRRVAVPVRLENNHIGNALLNAAKTRPKYIGGERAKYE